MAEVQDVFLSSFDEYRETHFVPLQAQKAAKAIMECNGSKGAGDGKAGKGWLTREEEDETIGFLQPRDTEGNLVMPENQVQLGNTTSNRRCAGMGDAWPLRILSILYFYADFNTYGSFRVV